MRRQRRAITLEYIEKQSIENKRNLECANPDFAATLRQTAADPQRTRDYLFRLAMIASLRRRRRAWLMPIALRRVGNRAAGKSAAERRARSRGW